MKKKYTVLFTLAFLLVLAACGNSTKDMDQVNDRPVTEENGNNSQVGTDITNESGETANTNDTNQNAVVVNQEEMQQKMDELDYADFELAVEYANHQEYEVELEKDSNNSIKAEIEDDLNNIKKKGSDAFNELFPLVQQLTITQQTSKEDAIQEVLATFNLPTDYQEFELDIRFKDGTKLEFEDKK